MIDDIIQISSEPVGRGRERTCYLHPEDPGKLIKISGDETDSQSRREIQFYQDYAKRASPDYRHLPRFHGLAKTNLGQGMLVDYIRDHDGQVSKSLRDYLDEGMSLPQATPYLNELKHYLLKNCVIFNHDMVTRNILLQHQSAQTSLLVLIDGIGDVVALPWLNRFEFHARSKIERRWNRFMQRLHDRIDQENANTG